LRRLQRDYVDVLFLHTWSRAWDHETAWYETLEQLKRAGKVRAIGISVPDEGITDANTHVALGRLDAIQCVYSVFQQEPEHSLLPLAEACGVGVIARSPFSSGAVVQSWSTDMEFDQGDWRASWPLDVKPGWLEDQIDMANRARPVLESSGVSGPVAALKFVLRQPALSSVIPGSANPTHVAENIGASSAPPMPDGIATQLEELWTTRAIHGTYNGSV
jgi:aryl-alcohol dehydrogenase-like predicted oxidoreductase